MAYTITQYETLVAAIAQGALVVEYADKKVQYRSLSEMIQIKRDMETELGVGKAGRPYRRYAKFSKGL